MTQLTTALDAALRQPQTTVFGAVEILLPGYALRLLEGSGFVDFGGHRYVGQDPTYGAIGSVTELTDGSGDQAPAINLTLIPSGDAAAASLAAATMQGSQVTLFVGAIDPATGQVIPDPYVVAILELDVATLKSGPNSRTLEYECTSVMERLFSDDEAARLSQGFHQAIWPGETGFAAVTGIDRAVYWGVAPPPNVVNAYNSGASNLYGSLTNGQRLAYV